MRVTTSPAAPLRGGCPLPLSAVSFVPIRAVLMRAEGEGKAAERRVLWVGQVLSDVFACPE